MTPRWADQPQWRILALGTGAEARFLSVWQAWKADPQRPHMLHFVALMADTTCLDELTCVAEPLSQELRQQCYGLLPGVHRLIFENGHVLLTLCIGDSEKLLRQLDFDADAVFLASRTANLKALARRCRRGTMITVLNGDDDIAPALQRHGFVVDRLSEKESGGAFAPAWEPRGRTRTQQIVPGRCVVIGAGLAGAAVAASMARRGWTVTVLDAASAPASGASALPAGLLVPHTSPDDSLLSRLSRDGVRATLQQAHALLQAGEDWEPSGVLEHLVNGVEGRRRCSSEAAADWTRTADAGQKRSAGIGDDTLADWHGNAAWIRPASLVTAWLAQPRIQVRCNAQATQLVRSPQGWQVEDAHGEVLASGELVIVAAALESCALLRGLSLQPVRGQVSWAPHRGRMRLPPFPVNGDGAFIPSFPMPGGRAWLCGSSFARDDTDLAARDADHGENLDRLRRVLPVVAEALEPLFDAGEVRAWTGIRCASTDRRPLVGPVAAAGSEGLWLSTAMGSRGLTFAALAAELIAARIHGEPLPVARKLADSLDPVRQRGPGMANSRRHG